MIFKHKLVSQLMAVLAVLTFFSCNKPKKAVDQPGEVGERPNIIFFIAGSTIIALMGFDAPTSMGAAMATLGNIGPGIGMVGPVDNYAFMPYAGKWFLSFLMLIGRLELFTVLILFSPAFWKK